MKKKREEKLHQNTAVFTILITFFFFFLLMFFFQPTLIVASVISLAEQCRSLIFILLNLVLLSVFFTSLHFTRPCNELEDDDRSHEKKETKTTIRIKERMGSRKQYRRQCNLHGDVITRRSSSSNNNNNNNGEKCCKIIEEDLEFLSEEELNRRSEAFIAMFRQHLISDSKRKSTFVAS